MICNTCGFDGVVADFARKTRCRECDRRAARARHARNPELKNANWRAWRRANPERAAAIQRRADDKRYGSMRPRRASPKPVKYGPPPHPMMCSRCAVIKSESDFGFHAPGKRRRQCKPCVQAVYREAYARDPEVRHAAAAHHAAWRTRNPERKLEINQRSITRRGDAVKTYRREYQRANSGRVNASVGKRKAAKLQQTLPLSPDHHEVMALIYEEAAEATRLTGIKHHVDHEVPLQGRTARGLHVPWNLRVVPWRVNLRKGTRLPDHL